MKEKKDIDDDYYCLKVPYEQVNSRHDNFCYR